MAVKHRAGRAFDQLNISLFDDVLTDPNFIRNAELELEPNGPDLMTGDI